MTVDVDSLSHRTAHAVHALIEAQAAVAKAQSALPKRDRYKRDILKRGR